MCNSLEKLQTWYAEQCDGSWEHQNGIRIETLDNPGWSVEIDLKNSNMPEASFAETFEERSQEDWIRLSAVEGRFKGFGGPRNLLEIIQRFLAWVNAEQ